MSHRSPTFDQNDTELIQGILAHSLKLKLRFAIWRMCTNTSNSGLGQLVGGVAPHTTDERAFHSATLPHLHTACHTAARSHGRTAAPPITLLPNT